MFLHLGESNVIQIQSIIGILSYEVVKRSSAMRRYMQGVKDKGSVVELSDGEFKSIILTDNYTYLCPVSVSTLKKRIMSVKSVNENILE